MWTIIRAIENKCLLDDKGNMFRTTKSTKGKPEGLETLIGRRVKIKTGAINRKHNYKYIIEIKTVEEIPCE